MPAGDASIFVTGVRQHLKSEGEVRCRLTNRLYGAGPSRVDEVAPGSWTLDDLHSRRRMGEGGRIASSRPGRGRTLDHRGCKNSPVSMRRAFAFRGDEHSATRTPAVSTAAQPTREPPEAEPPCPGSAPSGSEVATDRRRTAQAWLSRASEGYCLVGLASEAPFLSPPSQPRRASCSAVHSMVEKSASSCG